MKTSNTHQKKTLKQGSEIQVRAQSLLDTEKRQNTERPTAMMGNLLLSMKDITAHSGLSDKHFYSLIKRGKFPRPLKLGRSSRWMQSEYEQWLNEHDSHRQHSKE